MKIEDEFVKNHAPGGRVNHVVNLQFGKWTIPAKQRPAHALPFHPPPVGDVAQMRFDPCFAPDVFGFYNCHSRSSSCFCGNICMSLNIFFIFSIAFCWHAVIIGTNSSDASTRSVRKRRIWMARSLFCSAAYKACQPMLVVRLL